MEFDPRILMFVVFGAGRLANGTARAGVWTKPATALQLGECFRVIVYATACQMQVPAVFAGAKPPRDDAGAASAGATIQWATVRARGSAVAPPIAEPQPRLGASVTIWRGHSPHVWR